MQGKHICTGNYVSVLDITECSEIT